jgi:hypothetical protein
MAVTSLLEVSLAWKAGGNNVEKGGNAKIA